MNLGGRRIKNPELCEAFARLGFAEVSAFLASGNVVFEGEGAEAKVRDRLERGLAEELGYEVPSFIRRAVQVKELASSERFSGRKGADARGKLQVVFLQKEPTKAGRRLIATLDGDEDWLEVRGREVLWWPRGGMSESPLDLKALEKGVGPTTIRTIRTVERLAAKLL